MAEAGKGGGLFGGGKPPKGGAPAEGLSVSFLSQELTNLSTRMRVLEERNSNMKKKQEIVEHNMLSHRKQYSQEVELLKEEIDEIRRQIKEIESRIIMIIKELRMSANKEDVDGLKKYVELWEPVKFVTQNQVEKIVEEKIEELSSSSAKGK